MVLTHGFISSGWIMLVSIYYDLFRFYSIKIITVSIITVIRYKYVYVNIVSAQISIRIDLISVFGMTRLV